MRCSRGKLGCGRRFTLRRHPRKYKRGVSCPHCGSIHVVSTEKWDARHIKKIMHRCSMYPFPHRAGSLRMCVEHPDFMTDPTDGEIDDYEAVIATPRSGC